MDTQSPHGAPTVGWFNPIADFLGSAYWAPNTTRVQAFTTGTAQEIGFLIDALGLKPGDRILDLGCGPGRHSLALAQAGFNSVGVDLSQTFISLAQASAEALGCAHRATFVLGDVSLIEFDAEFDACICLCQGGFGLLGGAEDSELIARFGRALKPKGAIAVSAFHAYFALRHADSGDSFDPRSGVNHEIATLRNATGEAQHDLWTTCFTAKELDYLARSAHLDVDGIFGVTPGDYGCYPVGLDRPELLLLARRSR